MLESRMRPLSIERYRNSSVTALAARADLKNTLSSIASAVDTLPQSTR